jgi:hypothetical protein
VRSQKFHVRSVSVSSAKTDVKKPFTGVQVCVNVAPSKGPPLIFVSMPFGGFSVWVTTVLNVEPSGL